MLYPKIEIEITDVTELMCTPLWALSTQLFLAWLAYTLHTAASTISEHLSITRNMCLSQTARLMIHAC